MLVDYLRQVSVSAVLAGFSACICFLLFSRRSEVKKKSPKPPGPRPRFLVGNLFDVQIQSMWIKMTEWKAEFGDLVYINALGKGMLALNSLEAVNDLMERRPKVYSDRPTFVMAGEMFGLDKSMPLLPYDDVWRKHRKLTSAALNSQAVRKYHTLQEDLAVLYMKSLLETPENFIEQLRLTAGRIVLSVTYGLPVDNPNNSYITEAEHTMELIGKAIVPGAFLVEFIPFLKYVPPWFPFASFARFGAEGRHSLHSMVSGPLEHVKRQIQNGTALPSFALDCLTEPVDNTISSEEKEDLVLWAAGAMYGAGGESTYATILSFILALATWPEVQAKAKAEIHSVVGRNRLPTLQDRPSLPYVNACVKESLRWRPALPLGIARCTREDDIYKGEICYLVRKLETDVVHVTGFFIPAGTIVLPNVWAISKDEASGLPAEEFSPERFLSDHVQRTAIDPGTYAFGFGRRLCPGKFLAENSLFLLVSGILSTVTISKPLDSEGNPVMLEGKFTGASVSYPEPFKVDISPQSADMTIHVMERANSIGG